MGLLFAICGVPPILIGTGVVNRAASDPETPAWVAICAGLIFVAAGFAIILDYAVAGGVGPDGDLPAGTPIAVRAGNLALGSTIIGLMTAVFGWVAFGSGPRRFSSGVSLPFLTHYWVSGETSGRVAFGAATAALAAMFVACTWIGVERLARLLRTGS